MVNKKKEIYGLPEIFFSVVDRLPLLNDVSVCPMCGNGRLFEFRKGNNVQCLCHDGGVQCLDTNDGKLSVSFVFSCLHTVVFCLCSCPRLENKEKFNF